MFTLIPRAWVQASRTIAEHLILRPLRGIREVIAGLVHAGPDLFCATREAVVEAVDRRLSDEGRQNVRLGTEQILAGVKILEGPVAVALTVFVFLYPNVLWAAWVLVFATSFAV